MRLPGMPHAVEVGPGVYVDATIPRTQIDGQLVVCGVWTSGLPCWRRWQDEQGCTSCRLIVMLLNATGRDNLVLS